MEALYKSTSFSFTILETPSAASWQLESRGVTCLFHGEKRLSGLLAYFVDSAERS